jgi:hypothetical protein
MSKKTVSPQSFCRLKCQTTKARTRTRLLVAGYPGYVPRWVPSNPDFEIRKALPLLSVAFRYSLRDNKWLRYGRNVVETGSGHAVQRTLHVMFALRFDVLPNHNHVSVCYGQETGEIATTCRIHVGSFSIHYRDNFKLDKEVAHCKQRRQSWPDVTFTRATTSDLYLRKSLKLCDGWRASPRLFWCRT